VSYALDESLIEFNSLLEDRDYDAAVEVLEPLELTPETVGPGGRCSPRLRMPFASSNDS